MMHVVETIWGRYGHLEIMKNIRVHRQNIGMNIEPIL